MASRDVDEAYAEVVEIARADPNVVGFYLGGSRARGAETAFSDYDCCMIVPDDVAAEYKKRYTDWRGVSLWVAGVSEFERHAAIGSPAEWDRYTFFHLQLTFDKLGGALQRMVDEKGTLPADVARERCGHLDGYINLAYRSLKNGRDGRPLAALLDAGESIAPLLTAIYAMHGRMRPYNKYLRWDLEGWPLADLPWGIDEFLELLARIAAGDPTAQRAMFAGVRAMAGKHGLERIFAAWEDLSIFDVA